MDFQGVYTFVFYVSKLSSMNVVEERVETFQGDAPSEVWGLAGIYASTLCFMGFFVGRVDLIGVK